MQDHTFLPDHLGIGSNDPDGDAPPPPAYPFAGRSDIAGPPPPDLAPTEKVESRRAADGTLSHATSGFTKRLSGI